MSTLMVLRAGIGQSGRHDMTNVTKYGVGNILLYLACKGVKLSRVSRE